MSTFIKYNPEDSVISSEAIVAPCWTNGITTLTTFFTSSAQSSSISGQFFLDVYQDNPAVNTSSSQVQFSIAYGNKNGSGSFWFNPQVSGSSPTRDIYGQYRTLIYGDESASFNFGGSNGISDEIYVINVARNQYKESLFLGSLNLKLSNGSFGVQLTDNSNDVTAPTYVDAGRMYYIVSGTNGYSYNTSSIQTNSGSYGLFLPDISTLILNPKVLRLSQANGGLGLVAVGTSSPLSTQMSTGSNVTNSNLSALLHLIRSSNVYAQSFSLQSQETISARYFFTRVKNADFNYTTNPSIIDSSGNLIQASLINNPKTYITTVGLYNDYNELLAIAKLSRPLQKDFTKELLLRVKLSF